MTWRKIMDEKKYYIRSATKADLDRILAIERQCYPHPWTWDHFNQELTNSAASLDVCCCDGHLVGYHCHWLIAGEMQILNIAVAPGFRGQGIARALLEYAFSRQTQVGLERAWLEVRAGNRVAIKLYQSFGFTQQGRRKSYYSDGEDALLMVKDLV